MQKPSFVQKIQQQTERAEQAGFPLTHQFGLSDSGQPAFLRVNAGLPDAHSHWSDRELLQTLRLEPYQLAMQDALVVNIQALRAPNLAQLHQLCTEAEKIGADYDGTIYYGKNSFDNSDQLQFKAVMPREAAEQLLQRVAELTGVDVPSVARSEQGRGR